MESGTDRARSEEWFLALRGTFLDVARHRVPEGEVEDVVQDALRVVHERRDSLGADRLIDGRPPAAWCLQVLRFTIGNFYKRQRVRRGVIAEGDPSEGVVTGPRSTPLEALERKERLGMVEAALAELSAADSPCGRYLDRILEGVSPRDLARGQGLEESVLYRRVYRCRQKLKAILRRMGALP